MPRLHRINNEGYHHIINRGVEKRKVFLCDEDFQEFINILEEFKSIYKYQIIAYCLMENHYHLLLYTTQKNISLIMKRINQKYTLYFNNKYKRIGHLWQGRFKSWYVFDEKYLTILIKYIEGNPIRANIAENIGSYKWTSSNCKGSMLTEKERQGLDEFYKTKINKQGDIISNKDILPLNRYFANMPSEDRNKIILKAIYDGYKQSEVAKFLNLSDAALTKIVKIESAKEKLFCKLRDKGIFWSFSKDITYFEVKDSIIIEYILKYGDFDDIGAIINLYGKRKVQRIWHEKLKSDQRFIKTNLMIARVFFGMDIESDYFKGQKSARLEKLKILAS